MNRLGRANPLKILDRRPGVYRLNELRSSTRAEDESTPGGRVGRSGLLDLKTGSLHEAQVAMQLALYASGERYDNGQRSPLNVDRSVGS